MSQFEMGEGRARFLDALVKMISVMALVCGGALSLTRYFDERAEEIRNSSIEVRKPFLEKRLETYLEVTNLASKIAVTGVELRLGSFNGQERKRLKADLLSNSLRFAELYSGTMPLVEDGNVEKAMYAFGDCAAAGENTCPDISKASNALARACRDSIAEEWNVDLSPNGITFDDLEKLRSKRQF
jgi:hypothetical protein